MQSSTISSVLGGPKISLHLPALCSLWPTLSSVVEAGAVVADHPRNLSPRTLLRIHSCPKNLIKISRLMMTKLQMKLKITSIRATRSIRMNESSPDLI